MGNKCIIDGLIRRTYCRAKPKGSICSLYKQADTAFGFARQYTIVIVDNKKELDMLTTQAMSKTFLRVLLR